VRQGKPGALFTSLPLYLFTSSLPLYLFTSLPLLYLFTFYLFTSPKKIGVVSAGPKGKTERTTRKIEERQEERQDEDSSGGMQPWRTGGYLPHSAGTEGEGEDEDRAGGVLRGLSGGPQRERPRLPRLPAQVPPLQLLLQVLLWPEARPCPHSLHWWQP